MTAITDTPALARDGFRAMGTDVLLMLDATGTGGAPDAPSARAAFDAARAEVHRIERMASRFDPHSELSQLNATGEAEVSTDLLRLITLALAMRGATGGRFDPTVHEAVVAAGYDRPLDQLPADGGAAGAPMPAGGRVDIDPRTGRVVLGTGTCLDLGGIAKGWAADRVADELGVHGPCLVSMGGDIAVRGALDGGPWPVEVMHGDRPRVIGLRRGGMATSGTDRRRWMRAGVPMHHVVDPSTGRPSTTDLTRVTTIADDAATAEAWSTALLLAGRDAALREARARDITAVLVDSRGDVATTGTLAAPGIAAVETEDQP